MALRASLPSFFDELTKIAQGDLMASAAHADLSVHDGPPAAPFTKRKGYKKLEHSYPVKEAGIRTSFGRGFVKAKDIGKKVKDTGNYVTGTLYHRSPKPVRDAMHDMVNNPGSYGNLPQAFGKIFGG